MATEERSWRRRPLLGLSLLLLLQRSVADESTDVLVASEVLSPGNPYHVKLGIGQAKFLRFSCLGGAADFVVSLSTYAEHADPLLFLSLDPDQAPQLGSYDASSLTHWLEDSAGDHYVQGQGLGPRGGILGIINVRRFASEELNGILNIHCSQIIAFDALFWDHLRSSEVCPVGAQLINGRLIEGQNFCSGNGKCDGYGNCQCETGFAGRACEHRKYDIVVGQERAIQVQSGHYQYFRVHVPANFEGGFVEVKLTSSAPLVVLLKSDDLPTKDSFELSNFADWIRHLNDTHLRFKVTSSDGITGGPPGPYASDLSPRQLFGTTIGLARPPTAEGICPKTLPAYDSQYCSTPDYAACQERCTICVACVDGSDKSVCTNSCQSCISQKCQQTLALCASDLSCLGPEASQCEASCGSCITCLESNDESCQFCSCCAPCWSLAAKCMAKKEPRYVFVGIYNHRRYFNDEQAISAKIEISLTADPKFAREGVIHTSWTGDLYNSFHDMLSLQTANGQDYRTGDQFLYDVDVKSGETTRLQARVYRNRLTLILVRNVDKTEHMQLQFLAGPQITHVLTSSKAAPKTLFDFDNTYEQVGQILFIQTSNELTLWLAIFGAKDGSVDIGVRSFGASPTVSSGHLNFGFVCIMGLAFGGIVLVATSGSLQKLSELLGSGFVSRRRGYEGTVSLTGGLPSSSSFMVSDDIDASVEDQYLHRGGFGDEGL